jgi:hypothetical protein
MYTKIINSKNTKVKEYLIMSSYLNELELEICIIMSSYLNELELEICIIIHDNTNLMFELQRNTQTKLPQYKSHFLIYSIWKS